MRFPAIFLSLDRKISLKLNIMIACDNLLTSSKVKTNKNNFGAPNLIKTGQNRVQIRFFAIFLKFGSLVFL